MVKPTYVEHIKDHLYDIWVPNTAASIAGLIVAIIVYPVDQIQK